MRLLNSWKEERGGMEEGEVDLLTTPTEKEDLETLETVVSHRGSLGVFWLWFILPDIFPKKQSACDIYFLVFSSALYACQLLFFSVFIVNTHLQEVCRRLHYKLKQAVKNNIN